MACRRSADLIWEEASTSASADGGRHSAEAGMTVPSSQDKAAEEVSTDTAIAPTGKYL